MPEVVTVREDLGIIEVRSYGEVTEKELLDSRDKVAEIINDRGINRVLIEASKETSLPSTFPLFMFGSSLAEKDVLRTMKCAVVVSEMTKRDRAFVETVARNRGVELRIFDSTDAASDWLNA